MNVICNLFFFFNKLCNEFSLLRLDLSTQRIVWQDNAKPAFLAQVILYINANLNIIKICLMSLQTAIKGEKMRGQKNRLKTKKKP